MGQLGRADAYLALSELSDGQARRATDPAFGAPLDTMAASNDGWISKPVLSCCCTEQSRNWGRVQEKQRQRKRK